MPLTFSHAYGYSFIKRSLPCTKKAIGKRRGLAKRAGLAEDVYDAMVAGEAVPSCGSALSLEPYFAGLSEPIMLEQETDDFPMPHMRMAAVRCWRADVAALEKQIADLPPSIREDTLQLADFNYAIAVEKQDDCNYAPAHDYIGDFCAHVEHDAEVGAAVRMLREPIATMQMSELRKKVWREKNADEKFCDLLEMLNIACDDDALEDLFLQNKRVKEHFAKCPIAQEHVGVILRGIDARKRLLYKYQ